MAITAQGFFEDGLALVPMVLSGIALCVEYSLGKKVGLKQKTLISLC